MTKFLEPVELELKHVRVIVRGMVRVAESDGAHVRELTLIREFYESCRADVAGLADFADITKVPFDQLDAKEAIDSDQLKLVFLSSCYLVAYADGHVSKEEQSALDDLTKQLGISSEIEKQARELVKDQLLMQLSRSQNLPALQKIAQGL